MLGETEENWHECVQKTIALAPDSVTIYQMELPFNTTISRDLLKARRAVHAAGRELGDEAALGRGSIRSARGGGLSRRQRLHRDERSRQRSASSIAIDSGRAPTWSGLGVASFGHVNGVHIQNLDTWETYSAAIARGEHSAQPRLPADRRRADDS